MSARIVFIVVILVCGVSTHSPAADPILDAATTGNASSLGSIQTCYAKVAFRVTPAGAGEPSLEFTGQYWREPALVRVRQQCSRGFTGQTLEALITQGQQRVVSEQPGPKPNTFATGMQIADQSKALVRTDVWRLALFGLPPMDTEVKPLFSVSEAVERMTVKRVRTEGGSSGNLTRVTLEEAPGSTYTVWLDPSVNWLVRRVEREIDSRVQSGGKEVSYRMRTEYEVVDFSEVSPGIYFPNKVVIKSHVNGELSVVQEAEFSDVSVNRLKAPPFPIGLPIRAGMPVTDEIKGTRYTVDASGNPVSRATVLREAPAPLVPVAPNPNEQPPPGPLTRTSTWLLVLSALFATTAGVLIYRRRTRYQG